VSIVTGGGGGLGRAIAGRFIGRGDRVYVVDRSGDAARQVASELNSLKDAGHAVALEADVSSDDANRELIARVDAECGRLDRLVNNAGVHQHAKTFELDYDEWRRVLDVNLWSVVSLSLAAARAVWSRVPGGAIVNMSSRSWRAGGPLAYVASKAGIVGVTNSLAAELGSLGVTVDAVAPGTVLTPIVEAGVADAKEHERHVAKARAMTLLGRLATPDDVADVVDFLASDAARSITAELVDVAAGAHLPASPFRD
jgi:3-oxoacyl-[acyl-carrier protein] reductase